LAPITSANCGRAPGPTNKSSPIFSKPFAGAFPLANYFDHDLPFQFEDRNGVQLNSCGEKIVGRIDGHVGHDWVMPAGTRLLAVAAGEVRQAGIDPPFFCPPLGREVTDQQFVEVLHEAPGGERFSSVYVHLSRIHVRVSDRVTPGQVIGLSGNTGCSTEAHLHFHVWRHDNTNSGRPVRIDPFGWDGAGRDPWAAHPQGSESVWLWRDGQAPPLVLR
jgi:murein DD-endopeptidase MepM/ murein hydrolase activator NlpD